MGFSRQEHWSGLPFPSSGDLPDPGMEPTSLASPALASRFFTTRATWEAQIRPYICRNLINRNFNYVELGGQRGRSRACNDNKPQQKEERLLSPGETRPLKSHDFGGYSLASPFPFPRYKYPSSFAGQGLAHSSSRLQTPSCNSPQIPNKFIFTRETSDSLF